MAFQGSGPGVKTDLSGIDDRDGAPEFELLIEAGVVLASAERRATSSSDPVPAYPDNYS